MFYPVIKRSIDIVGSVIGIIVFSPLMIGAAIAIKLEDGGSILADIPERVGQDGKTFKMLKFRSMIENAHQFLLENPELYEEYKKNNYKLKNDPRITKIGRIIRSTSVDEMPQFINILRGEMSLIGPRAYYEFELMQQAERYPHACEYIDILKKAKPGLSGPWQVGGRSTIDFVERVKLDAGYVSRRSIIYDMWILIKTVPAVISRKGAE